MQEPIRLPGDDDKRNYWRANLRWLAGLLGVWLAVSFGCGILLVDWLDRFRLPGTHMKLGFWFAQQGSIYVFVILIAVYARVMNRLDRELLQGTSAAGGEES
jgi:putative solute:sodium symporter small subunit